MRKAWTCAASLLLLAAPYAMAACSKPVHVAPEHWPPYAIVGPDHIGGLDVELTEVIFKEAGCTLVIGRPLPVARRLAQFEQGRTDLMMAASSTPERRRDARLSIPYRYEEVSIFALPEYAEQYRQARNLHELVDLGASLLAPRVGWYGEEFASLRPQLEERQRISDYGSFSQGLKMLSAGRAQVILGDEAAIHYEAAQQNLNITHLSFTVFRDPVHLMFNRSTISAADLAQIDAAIARLEKSGALKTIRKRYGQP